MQQEMLHSRPMQKLLSLLLTVSLLAPSVALAQDAPDTITFPVDGFVSFSDTFDAPRSGGRTHEGTDIIADKHTPVLAAVDGEIGYAPLEEPSYGWIIKLHGDDGWTYVYIHLNNDNPGTDDGAGGRDQAVVPGIERGVRVEAGQHIGWLGDSGNAESTVPHLHFEIRDAQDVAINPYDTLVAAFGEATYDPDVERAASTDISTDLDLQPAEDAVFCDAGTRITSPETDTLYYCGRDGKRYVFQNQRVHDSWYEDFDGVIELTVEELAAVPFGGVVTYKPGVRLVKLRTVPKVYAIARNGVLRWVPSEEVAVELYGANWADQIDDIPDTFFTSYEVGDPVTTVQ